MKKRNISITLNKAKDWFNSNIEPLKEIALQAFSEEELMQDFRDITTFKKACEALNLNGDVMSIVAQNIAKNSKASAAMFKLNVIRKALNFGQDLHLTKDPEGSCIYYPYNPITIESSTFYRDDINSGKKEVIGKIKSEGIIYNVLGGSFDTGSGYGLSSFSGDRSYANASIGFLGCANKEIAQHFGRYFGMLATEAKYADMVDFEIIEEKHKV